jgi:hypothetical protein
VGRNVLGRVPQAVGEQPADMPVAQPVVHDAAGPPALHDPSLAQLPQMSQPPRSSRRHAPSLQ